jgi:Trypsin
MLRRLVPLSAVALALVLPAPASAVVGGDEVLDYADYPAQVFIGRNTNGTGPIDEYCTGTLVGSRQVLTAARCATYGAGLQLPNAGFDIRVGDPDIDEATPFSLAADGVERHSSYDPDTGANDVAMLTLSQPVTFADFVPERVVDEGETLAPWIPGTPATVAGWGEIGGGFVSEVLRTGAVSIRPDADCTDLEDTQLCAAGETQNPCQGDSGSPLLVPDGSLTALAGVFSGAACSTADAPGRYARVGDAPLNAWVHNRTPEADFDLTHQPRVGEPVRLFSLSRHPEGDDYFTSFRWDLDNNHTFGDRVGESIDVTFSKVGMTVVGLEASRPGGDRAEIYYRFRVDPAPAQGGSTTPPPTTGGTPSATGPLVTILVSGRPKVRKGRFPLRVRFAKTAPTGTAVIEVYRGKRRIGIARTAVRRGATKRVRVKLTPRGRRILRRAKSRRLRIRVRVRVGRDILRTQRVTIRR